MTINTVTHLNFRGDAREALEFYQSVFGGHLIAVTYQDAHRVTDPDESDQIIWGQVTSPDGFAIMAFDVPAARPWDRGEASFFVSIRGKDADEITRYWDGLSASGTMIETLAASQWSPLYGMVTDRFGITWVLDLEVEYNG